MVVGGIEQEQKQHQQQRAGAPALYEQSKKEKANLISQTGLYLCRQLPTLPHTFACSTIGPAGLNFRVRDGNGWNPLAKVTQNLHDAGHIWALMAPNS